MDGQQLIRAALSGVRGVLTAALLALIVAAPVGAVAIHRSGWQPLIERSGSMAPTIRVGELVVVDRMSATAMRPGDVVTFADPYVHGRTLTHRVVSVTPLGADRLSVMTKGDANKAGEHWTIARSGTVARMRRTVALPKVVAVLLDGSGPRGLLLLLLSVVACGSSLLAIWRRPRTLVSPAAAPPPCAPVR